MVIKIKTFYFLILEKIGFKFGKASLILLVKGLLLKNFKVFSFISSVLSVKEANLFLKEFTILKEVILSTK